MAMPADNTALILDPSNTADLREIKRSNRDDFAQSTGDAGEEVSSPWSEAASLKSSQVTSELPDLEQHPIDARRIFALSSEKEYELLLSEHRELVHKQFTEKGFSKKESSRLALVRWSLDRIEDARYGPGLDTFEGLIHRQEGIADEISATLRQLELSKSSSGFKQKKTRRGRR